MLVLSRRVGEQIVLPDLSVSIKILQLTSKNVRLGVEAPSNVAVLRSELTTADPRPVRRSSPSVSESSGSNHRMRNRLNAAQLALTLLEKQFQAGMLDDAQSTLSRAMHEFAAVTSELQPPPPPPTQAKPAAFRTLLVEDDINESELLAGILRMSGLTVATANDGGQAMDYLSHERPDIVLLDMRMPKFDGPSTVSAIRRDPRLQGLKVFAVSGTDPGELGLEVGPNGVDRWFFKPLDPGRLVREIQRELGGLHVSA